MSSLSDQPAVLGIEIWTDHMQTDVIIASSTKLDLWILLLENPIDNIILELGALDFLSIK